MEPIVRKAGLGDEGVLAVLNRVIERTYGASSGAETAGPVSTRFVVDRFHVLLRRSSVRAWVAERDGETMGYVLAQFHFRSRGDSNEVPVGVVEQLLVFGDGDDDSCPDLLGRLLHEVYEQGLAEGLHHIELTEPVRDYLRTSGVDLAALGLPSLEEGDHPSH